MYESGLEFRLNFRWPESLCENGREPKEEAGIDLENYQNRNDAGSAARTYVPRHRRANCAGQGRRRPVAKRGEPGREYPHYPAAEQGGQSWANPPAPLSRGARICE
jgi:hypothetical protein